MVRIKIQEIKDIYGLEVREENGKWIFMNLVREKLVGHS